MNRATATLEPELVPAARRTPAGGGEKPLMTLNRQPRVRAVDRESFLVEAARGRRVTHVGFTEEGSRARSQRDGHWLHARLDAVSAHLVGVDIDEVGVEQARAQGYEVYLSDCRDPADVARQGIPPADVVVVGEVIEHIDSVGPFLDGLHGLAETMILTTPNAFRLANFIAGLCRIECVHPDHVAWYSWFTLSNVLARHGWQVERFHTYLAPRRNPFTAGRGVPGGRTTVSAGRLVLGLERALASTFAPYLAEGLIAVCRSVPEPAAD